MSAEKIDETKPGDSGGVRATDLAIGNQLVLTTLLAFLATDKSFPAKHFIQLMEEIAEPALKNLPHNSSSAVLKVIEQTMRPLKLIVNNRTQTESADGGTKE